jgi:hypothetical protein
MASLFYGVFSFTDNARKNSKEERGADPAAGKRSGFSDYLKIYG